MKTQHKFHGRNFFVSLFLLSASALAESTTPGAFPEALNQSASNMGTVTATLTWSEGPVSGQTYL